VSATVRRESPVSVVPLGDPIAKLPFSDTHVHFYDLQNQEQRYAWRDRASPRAGTSSSTTTVRSRRRNRRYDDYLPVPSGSADTQISSASVSCAATIRRSKPSRSPSSSREFPGITLCIGHAGFPRERNETHFIKALASGGTSLRRTRRSIASSAPMALSATRTSRSSRTRAMMSSDPFQPEGESRFRAQQRLIAHERAWPAWPAFRSTATWPDSGHHRAESGGRVWKGFRTRVSS
jgi:hypothetical protein